MSIGGPSTRITASEYARQCDPPMGKSAISRLFKEGLPNYPGKDDHGRDCKFVDPVEADRWRATFTTPKMDPKTGLMHGMPSLRPAPVAPARDAPSPPIAERSPGRAAGTEPTSGPGPTRGTGSGEFGQDIAFRIQNARAVSAEEDAKARTYRRQALEGQLLDRDAAVDAHLRFIGLVASSLDRMPADQATSVSSKLGCTEHEAYLALREVTERLREDLAHAARQEATRLRLGETKTQDEAA